MFLCRFIMKITKIYSVKKFRFIIKLNLKHENSSTTRTLIYTSRQEYQVQYHLFNIFILVNSLYYVLNNYVPYCTYVEYQVEKVN